MITYLARHLFHYILLMLRNDHTTSSLVGALTSLANGLAAITELVEAGTLWDELNGGTEHPKSKSSLKQRNMLKTIETKK